jgi:signal transduction histidine kinase
MAARAVLPFPWSLAPRRQDVFLASGFLAVSQVEVWAYGVAGGSPAAALTLGSAAAAMVLRGRHPVLTTALVALALALCGDVAGEPFSATAVLTFTTGFASIGAMSQRRWSWAALVTGLALSSLAVRPLTLNDYLGISLFSILVPWLVGRLWARRREVREAEQRREAAGADAVAAERLRLAQELHDAVSHNVGMIAIQAGAADVLLDKDPARTRESLHAIEDGARSTLLELRRLLGLLRSDDPQPLTPRTTLAGLPELIDPVRGAGLEVVVQAMGDPVQVGDRVEAAAYRVVQEALTNAVAHAGPCRVAVTLRWSADELDVEVSDDGAGRPGTSHGGYGLTGIRERVTAIGGTVTAGPRADGGFTVRALLPVAAP